VTGTYFDALDVIQQQASKRHCEGNLETPRLVSDWEKHRRKYWTVVLVVPEK